MKPHASELRLGMPDEAKAASLKPNRVFH
jgi:hypothetical protein